MTSPTETSTASRPGKRIRTAGPGKVIAWLIVLFLVLVVMFYAIGGWHFSGEIYACALQVHHPAAGDLDITLDLGFDVSFSSLWALRFGATVGDREGLALGVVFR